MTHHSRCSVHLGALMVAFSFISDAPTVNADDALLKFVEARRTADHAVALQLWNWAEVGYQEEHSSARLQKELRDADFSVKARVVGMPTAFVAEYGSG